MVDSEEVELLCKSMPDPTTQPLGMSSTSFFEDQAILDKVLELCCCCSCQQCYCSCWSCRRSSWL